MLESGIGCTKSSGSQSGTCHLQSDALGHGLAIAVARLAAAALIQTLAWELLYAAGADLKRPKKKKKKKKQRGHNSDYILCGVSWQACKERTRGGRSRKCRDW